MNGFERVHECVGGYTDAGQHEVHTDEPIVRCADCECSYAPEHFMPGRLICKLNNGVWKPGDFCSRGVPVAETRRTNDE
jgi:hypothetical protein